jgi:hypothetical protein
VVIAGLEEEEEEEQEGEDRKGRQMQIAATSSPFRLSHFFELYTRFLLFFDFIDLIRF